MKSNIHLESSLWIDKENQGFLGKGRIEILKGIEKHGSLMQVAKEMKMSYKAAWDTLSEMRKLSDEELIVTNTGGKGGGGTTLTPKAKHYIAIYDLLYQEQRKFLKNIENHTQDIDELKAFLKKCSLKTSARNQLFGKVLTLSRGKINSHVTIQLQENVIMRASITDESVKELGIKKNADVYALIKASWVYIAKNVKAKEENFNYIEGLVESLKIGTEFVKISLHVTPNITITSVMNRGKFDAKDIKKGDNAIAIFKISDVIIGV
ncbi:MAG: TOBE domain-containing protein [Sulfurospirillaceae bacterium]|nr:TOBE domain-containing protein [Sulfurospirillaceae bacterium]